MMSDHSPPPVVKPGVLYDRRLPNGYAVRIRRTSDEGESPVQVVLEVDRRVGTPREHLPGFPPPLMLIEADTAQEALAQLEPFAKSDYEIARLMAIKGIR
jgi:hypothetical protein